MILSELETNDIVINALKKLPEAVLKHKKAHDSYLVTGEDGFIVYSKPWLDEYHKFPLEDVRSGKVVPLKVLGLIKD